jgi:uncharacterized protein (TIGR04255 family)
MTSDHQYANAPITEAIIQLRVVPRDNTTHDDLLQCRVGLEQTYPLMKEINESVGHFELGQKVTASASSKHVGAVFTDQIPSKAFQVRFDGFSMSRFAPYCGWEQFRDEARTMWDRYRAAVRPVRIERIAVRYINRLDLPGPRVELKNYLHTYPEFADGHADELDGFFLQVHSPVPDLKGRLIVNETLVDAPRPGLVSVALDIDLVRTEDLPQAENDVWQLIETMRLHKNKIFEACITNLTRGLIS